jgi:antitoxin MazE
LTKYCNYIIITFKEENMVVSVIPIGNSKGIRIPKNILTELKIENEAEMNITNDEIIIRRIEKNPREGWEESFKKMHQVEEDQLLIPSEFENNFFEWDW